MVIVQKNYQDNLFKYMSNPQRTFEQNVDLIYKNDNKSFKILAIREIRKRKGLSFGTILLIVIFAFAIQIIINRNVFIYQFLLIQTLPRQF